MKKLLLIPVLFAMFVISGCQKEDSINAPVSDVQSTTVQKTNWQIAAEKQGLKFIQTSLMETKSLSKVVSSTVWGTVAKGANLNLSYRAYTRKGITTADVRLTIPAYALPKDQSISMSFDGEYMMTDVDLTFGPHGIQFLKPALLNVFATGLDLSDYPASVKSAYLWYYNEVSGVWERMNADLVFVDVEHGMLGCINGYLPHFSRYGFTTAPETNG